MDRKTSPIWEFFTCIDRARAKCKICHAKIGYNHSTSNLKRHLKNKHPSERIKDNRPFHKTSGPGSSKLFDINLRERRANTREYPIESDEQEDYDQTEKEAEEQEAVAQVWLPPSVSDNSEPSAGKKNRRTSPIWQFFTSVDDEFATCDICSCKIGYRSSTSNMKRHMKNKHKSIKLYEGSESKRVSDNSLKDPFTSKKIKTSTSITQSNEHEDVMSTSSSEAEDMFEPEVDMSRKFSPVWTFFTAINSEIAKCNICDHILNYKTSTSTMRKHVKSKHKLEVQAIEEDLESNEIWETRLDTISEINKNGTSIKCESTPAANISKRSTSPPLPHHTPREQSATTSLDSTKNIPVNLKRKIDEQLCLLFTLDFQPYSIVDDKGFISFVKKLNPNYTLPTKQTIAKTFIPAMYDRCLRKCKVLASQITHVCLSIDSWTSMSSERYLSATAHYIDNNFELKSMFLKCSLLSESHTSENISATLEEIVQDWGLSGKVTLAISDNDPTMRAAITDELGWKHFGCFAHTLNLVVQNGIRKASDTIEKVREIVGHFRINPSSCKQLFEAQKRSGIGHTKKLKLDVWNQWNSTLHMIQRFVELEDAIQYIVVQPTLTAEEWDLLKDLIQILTPFETISTAASNEKYLPASFIIVFVKVLNDFLEELKHSSKLRCISSKQLVEFFQIEIESSFGNAENNITLAFSTFLDPRFKTHVFNSTEAADSIKKNVICLVTSKISEETPKTSTVSEQTGQQQQAEPQKLSIWGSIDKTLAKYKPKATAGSRAISEILRYLESDLVNREVDPLRWWKDHACVYPNLSTLAKEKLCVVATSVPCERLFSSAGHVLNEQRTRLKSSEVEKILFLNANHNLM